MPGGEAHGWTSPEPCKVLHYRHLAYLTRYRSTVQIGLHAPLGEKVALATGEERLALVKLYALSLAADTYRPDWEAASTLRWCGVVGLVRGTARNLGVGPNSR